MQKLAADMLIPAICNRNWYCLAFFYEKSLICFIVLWADIPVLWWKAVDDICPDFRQ